MAAAKVLDFPTPTAQPQPAPKPAVKKKSAPRRDARYMKTKRYTDENGVKRRKCFYGKTEAEASKKLRAFSAKKIIPSEPSKATVAAWAETWIATYKSDVEANTVTMYRTHLRRITAAMGSHRMASITHDDCQRWINGFKGKSYSTIKKHYNTLLALFETARLSRVVSHNPAEGIAMPKGPKGTHQYIRPENQQIITDTWEEHRCGAIGMLMLLAGLRRGEAIGIRAEDISQGKIRVSRAIRFEDGKPVAVSPKTKAGERAVPILTECASVIRRIMDTKAAPLTKLDGGAITHSAFRKAWASYQKFLIAHGCTQTVRCHDLRHTFATTLCRAGVNIKTMQYWLGHASALISMDIYAHMTQEQQEEDIERMEAYVLVVK